MDIKQSKWSSSAWLAVAAVAAALVPVAACAQPKVAVQMRFGMAGRTVVAGMRPENVFPRADRLLIQRLDTAGESIPRERYVAAVKCLQDILDSPEDHFFQPDRNVSIHRSLKAEAQRMIGQLPRAGRDLYRVQYGSDARQMLEAAVTAGNPAKLAEVSRRFYHTEAGYEATLLLGLHHYDHGRPLAAALTFQRLGRAMPDDDRFEPRFSLALATCWLQIGMPDQARGVLAALMRRRGSDELTVAGGQISLPSTEAEAVDRLATLAGPVGLAGPAAADNWGLHRGSPSRRAVTSASVPLLNLLWRIPAAYGDESAANGDDSEETTLRRLMRERAQQGLPVVPATHPLAIHREFTIKTPGKRPWHIEDVVLLRTTKSLLAVDFATGKRIWETGADRSWSVPSPRASTASTAVKSAQRARDLATRMWQDSTYGTLSSDGELVFSIEDLDSPTSATRAVGLNVAMGSATAPRGPYNRLAAHDIRTGKIRWHLGGPADEYALREAETFFLGPPLPLMGRLYVLAEVENEIRLMVLDGKTGETLWNQRLATAEMNVVQDRTRRLAAASPSYADGILICPTSAGAVVAIDLATRSLLWGYSYRRDYMPNVSRSIVIINGVPRSTATPKDTWIDSTATVVDGRVLISPPESQWLHCLNLVDGQLFWKCKRDGDLYVACADGDKVILVGRDKVRAVSAAETIEHKETVETMQRTIGGMNPKTEEITVTVPKPAWDGRTIALPDGGIPAGRGVRSAGRYFLSLNNAEVVTIDLQAGKIVERAKSRMNSVPGNLICYRGKIISQSYDGVEKYLQLDSAREEAVQRLAVNPNDAKALSLQGEVRASEGRHAEAVARFERAYQIDADPRTRVMLRDALLEGLHREFAAHRGRAEQIEKLLDSTAQRAAYLRLMAAGLQHAGEWQGSLEFYLKLIDLDSKDRTLDAISGVHSVRRDRCVQARLATLRDEAKAEAASIDVPIEARLRSAVASQDTQSLRRFLDYFGNQPAGAEARRELVRRLIASGDLLEAELLLRPQRHPVDGDSADGAAADDRNKEAAALAELAQLLQESPRVEHAALCYRRLAQQFGDVVCREGKTGKELVEALPADGAVRKLLDTALPGGDADWPVGNVEIAAAATASGGSVVVGSYPSTMRFPLAYQGNPGPFLADTVVLLQQDQRALLGYDALGGPQWKMSLTEPGSRSLIAYNPSLTYCRGQGHLLLLTTGRKVLAIDTLGLSGGEVKLRWSKDLNALGFDQINPNGALSAEEILIGRMAQAQFQVRGGVPYRTSSGSTTKLGPVTGSYISFQQNRHLAVADPMTGEILWVRRDLPLGAVVFGDEELLFAVGPEKEKANVYRALDGKLLGQRKIPRFKSQPLPAAPVMPGLPVQRPPVTVSDNFAPLEHCCLGSLGRQLLLWRVEDGKRVLELFDPWQQRSVWTALKVDARSMACLVGDEAVGVFEPDGHFVLMSLPDGRAIVDAKLKPEENLQEIVVFRSGDRYMLITNGRARRSLPHLRPFQTLPRDWYRMIGHGWVYAFDLSGKSLWPEPTEIENRQFSVKQPGRLPVLAFFCQTYDSSRGGSSTNRYEVTIDCIDKRTGRKFKVAQWPATRMAGHLELAGHPQKKTVDVRIGQKMATLTFTDDPIPPPSEEKPDEEPLSGGRVLGAAMKALFDATTTPDSSAEKARKP
ncbi:MAG: PQQ-binding-like beta-propeller repeat protein [Candidatus Nealsonbacteria bacterium]|nr:PQQ-binding-like beta-propeller repeat protein [Candidatus Nealsonbacteria bacterium]